MLAVATGLMAGNSFAQSPYDFDDQGRPVERYTAHASCNSKVLRDAGFRIAKHVPGHERECYWVRDNCAQSNQSVLPDYARSETSLTGALHAARIHFDKKLHSLAEERMLAVSSFLKEIAACGTDSNCQLAAMEKRRADERALDSEITKATLGYQRETDTIHCYFLRREEPPRGTVARPGR